MWSYWCYYIHFIILPIERAEVHYPQGHNNKYVSTICYYHYSITLYSHEDSVQTTTTTTTTIDPTSNTTNATTSVIADPYHISHNEVCTVITTCLYSTRCMS